MPPFPSPPPLLPLLFLLLYNHSAQLRREIQPIQIQPTPIIHHNPLYATCSLVLLNLFFQFQQCFVSRQAVGVGRVGTNDRSWRWALRRPARCSAPPLARGARSGGRCAANHANGSLLRNSLGGLRPGRPYFRIPELFMTVTRASIIRATTKSHPRRRGAAPPAKPQGG